MLRRALPLCLVLLSPVFVGLPSSTASAAPPAESDEDDADEDPGPTLDEAKLMVAREFNSQGEERFNSGDFLGAIEMWEQVWVLMPNRQATLRSLLGQAHHGAYASDDDVAHLREAHRLLTEQLASLDADDGSRDDLEAEIAEIDSTLDALAAAEAEAQAKREAEIIAEQTRLKEQALAAAEAEHQRGIQKIYLGVGGSLAGLGVGSLAGMAALLVLGQSSDARGEELAKTVGSQPSDYTDALNLGQTYNQWAYATGIAGGVLTVAGTSLLVVATLLRKRGGEPQGKRARLTPGIGSLQLRF